MRDSGVEWIGEVPEGWEIVPSGCFFSEVKEKNVEGMFKKQLSFKYGEIVDKTGNDATKEAEEEVATAYRIVTPDTIMINGLNLNYDLISQRVAIVKETGIITSAYLAVKGSEKMFPKFSVYLFKGYDSKQVFHSYGSGIRKTLKYSDFKDIPSIVPPLPEQRRIADYLDEKCAAIDGAVDELKRGIEDCKAWKKAIIFEAVTGKKRVTGNGERGMGRMRDSGIPWIGEIPEGWEVKPLRRLGRLANGISKGGEYFGKGFPFVSYSDVYKNDAIPTQVKGLVEANDQERERYSVKRGDVFFTRTSETVDEIGIAAACLKDIQDSTFAGFLIRFRPMTDELLPEFSKYYFRNKLVSEYFAKELVMVTRASLGQELLKSLPVFIPPMKEQQAIADYLDEKCAAIDALVTEKESLIADLEAYKKSLIYETVTGKREVA
jgi:type I restriction enzyme S subunit